MPTNDERREVAAKLRELAQESARCGDDGVGERACRVLLGPRVDLLDVVDAHFPLARLAELIEPEERTCHIAEAFHEMALELADARAELRRLRRTARIDRERAEMVSQLEDENLELKKRLGFFGDLTPPVSWYAAMREENERLNRELMEAMR